MASGGRGRGRGRGAIFLKDNKPGGLQDKVETDELVDLIKGLTVDIEAEKIKSCVDIATKQATTSEALDRIVKTVYKPCYEDWQLSGNAALICQKLSHLDSDGVKLRDVLLRTIQSDFKSKEEIRSVSVKKFVGCCAFLCQVFYYLRSSDGAPFKPLSGPILECFELLLDNRAEEMELECACEQLLTVGPLIHHHGDAKRLAKLKNSVRDKILDTNISRDLRLCLIDVIEAFASQWTLNIITPTSIS